MLDFGKAQHDVEHTRDKLLDMFRQHRLNEASIVNAFDIVQKIIDELLQQAIGDERQKKQFLLEITERLLSPSNADKGT